MRVVLRAGVLLCKALNRVAGWIGCRLGGWPRGRQPSDPGHAGRTAPPLSTADNSLVCAVCRARCTMASALGSSLAKTAAPTRCVPPGWAGPWRPSLAPGCASRHARHKRCMPIAAARMVRGGASTARPGHDGQHVGGRALKGGGAGMGGCAFRGILCQAFSLQKALSAG